MRRLYTDWKDKAQVDKFIKELMLDIYFEFCNKARDERRWQAGFEVINKLG